jgi:hypothetical protein
MALMSALEVRVRDRFFSLIQGVGPMHSLTRVALTIGAATLVGCERSTPVQPDLHAGAASFSQATAPGKPEIDPTWANGKTVYMIGPHAVEGARESMPNAYAHAEELYLVVFPQPQGAPPPGPPITLPSGYHPQCNPCFHPGLPAQNVYHDHIITGAPGMGVNGTAGEFKAPWKIIVVVYDPAYAASKDFKPITSAADLDAAEHPGIHKLLPFNQGAANPYEFETGNLLICPIVSSHA